MYMQSAKTKTLPKEDLKVPMKNSTKPNPYMPTTGGASSKGYVLGRGSNTTTTNQSRMQGGQVKSNPLNLKNNQKNLSTIPLNSKQAKPPVSHLSRFPNRKETLNKSKPLNELKSLTKPTSDFKSSVARTSSQLKQRPNTPSLIPQRPIATRNEGGRPSEARILSRNPRATEFNDRSTEVAKIYRFKPPVNDANRIKIWNRNPAPAKPKVEKSKVISDTTTEAPIKPKAKTGIDFCMQVYDSEIMDPDLIGGEAKVILPSKDLVRMIDNERHQKRLERLLKAERKFEPHALEEKEHLTDLKEFLESAAIKKRPRQRKTIDQLEEDRRMIGSMDEMFRKPLPKPESITDITQRIKRKEEELLSMFDSFYKLKIPGITSKLNRDEEEELVQAI